MPLFLISIFSDLTKKIIANILRFPETLRWKEKLKSLLLSLKMIPIGETVSFSKVQEVFDRKNNPKDQSYNLKVERFLDELVEFAEIFKKK